MEKKLKGEGEDESSRLGGRKEGRYKREHKKLILHYRPVFKQRVNQGISLVGE